MFKITHNQKNIEGAFYLVEGIVLVGLTEDLEEKFRDDISKLEGKFRDDISKLGYKVSEINADTLRGISNHSEYWIYLKNKPEHFKGISLLLDVIVGTDQEKEAIKQLKELPYIKLAERMYGKYKLYGKYKPE